MISYRSGRKYISYIINIDSHQAMIDWKVQTSRGPFQPLPGKLYEKLIEAIQKYFADFDCLTVSAPSFHTYDHYPIWEVAKSLSLEINLPLVKLFPNHSGKTEKYTFGSIHKVIQDIACTPGQFILILDDIYTTGHTMRVSCEAIARKGSFPCGIVIA